MKNLFRVAALGCMVAAVAMTGCKASNSSADMSKSGVACAKGEACCKVTGKACEGGSCGGEAKKDCCTDGDASTCKSGCKGEAKAGSCGEAKAGCGSSCTK